LVVFGLFYPHSRTADLTDRQWLRQKLLAAAVSERHRDTISVRENVSCGRKSQGTEINVTNFFQKVPPNYDQCTFSLVDMTFSYFKDSF
jgi:hypothetical protein